MQLYASFVSSVILVLLLSDLHTDRLFFFPPRFLFLSNRTRIYIKITVTRADGGNEKRRRSFYCRGDFIIIIRVHYERGDRGEQWATKFDLPRIEKNKSDFLHMINTYSSAHNGHRRGIKYAKFRWPLSHRFACRGVLTL